ncbi:hypothetical protein JAAARDRAFT_191891 [Jaapia argillacea MUCL 33604]|uniref:F-box domain-containing protein n=1 Tax=Jaapia argillacea MUCL 33604 TaxID=933084 RepID=A0A067QD48_9AGAM|nr:hypothetical protein JAAARDRAFT_191891 [Jaapia argillacea MUCL 33604]
MHALHIKEVYREVCEQLCDWKPGWERNLFNLSLTSRGFSEEAMNSLWKDLPDIVPLLGLFPPSVVEVKGEIVNERKMETYKLVRPPEREDWVRFDFYGRRVRQLCCRATATNGRVCHLLSQYRQGPLLSLLRQLWWSDKDVSNLSVPQVLSFITTFTSSSLRVLSISFPYCFLEHATDEDYLVAFLHALSHRCPGLTTAVFHGLPPSTSLSFVGLLKCLRVLKTEPEADAVACSGDMFVAMDDKALRAVSNLPYLTKLDGLNLFEAKLDPTSLMLGFPSLIDLGIRIGELRDVGIFLNTITSRTFRTFSTWTRCRGDPEGYLGCLRALRWSSLVHLELHLSFHYDDSNFITIGETVIKGLSTLMLPNLEHLELYHCCNTHMLCYDRHPVAIPPDAAARMALAWPKLRWFCFEESAAAFSIESLEIFLSHYPSGLPSFSFDALAVEDIVTTIALRDPAILSPKVERLTVRMMMEDVNDQLLAIALDIVFPNLDLSRCFFGDSEVLHFLAKLHHGREARGGLSKPVPFTSNAVE